MKNFFSKVICVALILAMFCSEGRYDLQAKTTEKTVKNIGLEEGKTKSIQLDGKGAKEKVKYTLEIEEREDENAPYYSNDKIYETTFSFFVNKKMVYSKKFTLSYSLEAEVAITDIDKSDKKMDIFMGIYPRLYTSKYEMLVYAQYGSGKLSAVQDLKKYLESNKKYVAAAKTKYNKDLEKYCRLNYFHPQHGFDYIEPDISTTGDGNLDMMCCMHAGFSCGHYHGTFRLKLKNGKLKVATAYPEGKIVETDCSDQVLKKITLYATPGGNKKVYTAKKGERILTDRYAVRKGVLYVHGSNDNGKSGWFKDTKDIFEFDGLLHVW